MLRKYIKGITLTEMAVVLTIIGVIFAVTLLSDMLLFSRRLQAETYKIVTDLAWARQMSAKADNDYCVRFSSGSYTIREGSGSCTSGTILREAYFVSDLDSPSTPFAVTFHDFNRVSGSITIGGTMSNSLGYTSWISIRLSHGHNDKEIRIYTKTGYIRLRDL